MRLGGVALLGLLLGLSGCAPDYATSNAATVNLIIAAINVNNVNSPSQPTVGKQKERR